MRITKFQHGYARQLCNPVLPIQKPVRSFSFLLFPHFVIFYRAFLCAPGPPDPPASASRSPVPRRSPSVWCPNLSIYYHSSLTQSQPRPSHGISSISPPPTTTSGGDKPPTFLPTYQHKISEDGMAIVLSVPIYVPYCTVVELIKEKLTLLLT